MRNKNESSIRRHVNSLIEKSKKMPKPIEWVSKSKSAYSVILCSRYEEDRHNIIALQFNRLIIRLLFFRLVKPLTVSVLDLGWGGKRSWSYLHAECMYGIGLLPKERLLLIYYGVNSGNKKGFPRDRIIVNFLRWGSYRLTRHDLIDKNGNIFWSNNCNSPCKGCDPVTEALCPRRRFECKDEDDNLIIGSCAVDHREWVKSLTLFGKIIMKRKKLTKRTLKIYLQVVPKTLEGKPSLEISEYTMLPDETLEEAIVRYCSELVVINKAKRKLYLAKID